MLGLFPVSFLKINLVSEIIPIFTIIFRAGECFRKQYESELEGGGGGG